MGEVARRDFLKGAAVAGMGLVGAVSMAACAPQSAASSSTLPSTGASAADIEWDREADVVVVGGGGTGMCAAWEAANAGCSVLVLEKSEMLGGNTSLSGGMIQAAGTELQKANGVEDDVERYAEEQVALGMDLVDEEIVRDMCYQSPDMITWLEGLGRVFDTLASVPSFKPYSNDENWARRVHQFGVGTADYGKEHTDKIWADCERLGCESELNTEVVKLICDDANGVVGVVAKEGTNTMNIKANKGVVLAAAGIDNNKEMAKELNKLQYFGLKQVEAGFGVLFEKPSNTGDGIRMGMEIGAALNLSDACVMIPALYPGGVTDYWSFENPGTTTNKYNSAQFPGSIIVNCRGNRFMQEDGMWGMQCGRIYREIVDTGRLLEEPGNTGIFAVTDSSYIEYWRTADKMGSASSLDEMVASGALYRADTLEDLAAQIGVETANFTRTVSRWNDICDAGVDYDFARETDFGRIENGPFYAFPINFFTTMGTAGGLKINKDCQVIDVNGEVIPRLYAGGMNAGGWMGHYYHSCGWAVLGTVVLGRNAGRHVATLDSWA